MREWPRDALALAPATGVFGLIGCGGRRTRKREPVEFLMPLSRHYGEDWWFATSLGFALIEHDAAARGTALARAAPARRPNCAYAAHTYIHGLYELRAHDEALPWLRT